MAAEIEVQYFTDALEFIDWLIDQVKHAPFVMPVALAMHMAETLAEDRRDPAVQVDLITELSSCLGHLDCSVVTIEKDGLWVRAHPSFVATVGVDFDFFLPMEGVGE